MLTTIQLIILIVVCVFILLYYSCIKPHRYWQDQGAKVQIKPWPFIGTVATVFQTQSKADFVKNLCEEHSDRRYILFYQFLTPVILINDLRLLNRILVRDFHIFPEHTQFSNENNDPIWCNNLFAMRGGERYNQVKQVMSPSFTNSKIKIMFELVNNCALRFVQHLIGEKNFHRLDVNDAFKRVTTDIVATIAVGIKCDSWMDRDNEIYENGINVSSSFGGSALKFLIASISPTLVKLLGIRFVDRKATMFFRNLIAETIRYREETDTYRFDMLQMMMEARRERLRQEKLRGRTHPIPITDDLITAQAVVFFVAGLDSTTRSLSFTAYELAINPNIQQQLRSEIHETLSECNDKITYDILTQMKYLDMVVLESLRKWPPVAVTDRRSVKSYTLISEKSNESLIKIDPRVIVEIPIFAIHRNPKYYPKPEVFDPERFKYGHFPNENQFAFMPFGRGPRNCIGHRIAKMIIKTILVQLLNKFEIVPIDRTDIPLRLDRRSVSPMAENGFWLGLRRIR